jgi:hypothetical protein
LLQKNHEISDASSLLHFGPATSLKTRLKPNTDFRNMATQPVCLFNKFGHCKFQKKCKKMHIIEVCGILDCEVRNCKLRHPKVCSFYRDFLNFALSLTTFANIPMMLWKRKLKISSEIT